jgi:hypothetical protein
MATQVTVGELTLDVYHCPGHTPGHVVFHHARIEAGDGRATCCSRDRSAAPISRGQSPGPDRSITRSYGRWATTPCSSPATASRVDDLVAQDVNSPEFGKRVDAISAMGQKEIREAAGQSNRFLDRPVKAMDRKRRRRRSGRAAPHDRGSRSRQGQAARAAQAVRDHPVRQQAEAIISTAIKARRRTSPRSSSRLGRQGRAADGQCRDRRTERANLWNAMGRLEQMIHLSKTMDKRLEDKANELDATDPAKAKAIRETALFYVRQRTRTC